MDGHLADVVWTDPPYNVQYVGKTADALTIENDRQSASAFAAFLEGAFGALTARLKKGGAIYVAHADTEGLAFRSAFIAAGLKLSGCLIWRKDQFVMGRSDYQWQHEPILYGWRPGASHHWYAGRKQTTVADLGVEVFLPRDDGRWQIRIGDRILIVDGNAHVEEAVSGLLCEVRPKRSTLHPTMKPVALIERMLRCSAVPGQLILDPFGGSGSTLIAADRLGMRAALIEIDPRYVDVIVSRWQQYAGAVAHRSSDGVQFDRVQLQSAAA
jgi:DNA modification methylase